MDRATSHASSTLVAEPFAGDGIFRSSSNLSEALAILGEIDIFRIGADDRHARGLQRQRQRQRRLAAELDDHAVGLLGVADVQHFFERERLEVQAVAGVVIGRNRLRIAVHHDRLDAELLQRERGVAAAVVELDSLADAIRAAAQDHDLLAIRWIRLALRFVARIKIGREAFEFGRAGIDAIEHRRDAQFFAARAHRQRFDIPGARQIACPTIRRVCAVANCSRVTARKRNCPDLFPDPPFRGPAAGTTDRWRSARAPALRCSRCSNA